MACSARASTRCTDRTSHWRCSPQCCARSCRRGLPRAPARPARADALARLAPGAHGVGQLAQQRRRVVPADAGVGDALAVAQRAAVGDAGLEALRAADQVTLDHHAEDLATAALDLRRDVAHDRDLPLMTLAA